MKTCPENRGPRIDNQSSERIDVGDGHTPCHMGNVDLTTLIDEFRAPPFVKTRPTSRVQSSRSD